MKILQHYHPQGSHIFRTIIEAAQLFNQGLQDIELASIFGANFLGAHNAPDKFSAAFHSCLKSHCTLELPTALVSFESFDSKHYTTTEDELSPLDARAFFLLENSVRDSLFRGLSPVFSTFDLYANCDGPYFQDAFCLRLKYASALFSYYLKLIRSFSPDLVTISHGNYDYYIALYLAARCNNIPVLLVHGGFNRSWLINNQGEITDHSYTSEKIRILRALNRADPNSGVIRQNLIHHLNKSCNKQSRIEAHVHSSFSILSQLYAQSLQHSGDIHYVIMMPILGEVCHQDCFFDVNFTSKPQWLDETFKTLAQLPHKVIIRHHPEVAFYNERSLSLKYLEYLSCKYNLPIQHVFTNEDFSACLLDIINSSASFIPLSFGSTISSELATASLTSISANGCLASVIPHATIYQHQVDLFDPRPSLRAVSSKLATQSTILSDLDTLLRWVNLTGKHHSADRLFRLRSDLHLFFGRPAIIPNHEVSYTLQDYMNSVSLSYLQVDDCYHIYI